jgi:lysyl-tRNA synthetase class 2
MVNDKAPVFISHGILCRILTLILKRGPVSLSVACLRDAPRRGSIGKFCAPVTLPPWHPDEYLRRKPHLEARQRVIAATRGFFAAEDFAEVETPILQISPGNETHLRAFATALKSPRGEAPQKRYLHTSPEFAMKKLLVAGVPRLYQLAHAFRNGERSSLHHPEFLMLEWYRAEATLGAIMEDCVRLVRAAAQAAGRRIFATNGMICDPFGDWEMLSVPEAFRRYADIDLLATMPKVYESDAAMLAQEARRIGVHAGEGDRWDDLFFRIMGERIEPHLGETSPTFLCDYPVSQAALARPKPDNPKLAERFELYICGIELANAFGELTDAGEQERRFQADMNLKEKLYGERYPIDADFIAALRHGMPESAGIALGFDRLVMLCAGVERIEDVLWLPVAD